MDYLLKYKYALGEMHNIAENGGAAHSRYKQNQEQQTVTPRELNLLTKAYEILDQGNLTESALFAYLQEIQIIWNVAL